MKANINTHIDRFIQSLVDRAVIPGISVLVGKGPEILFKAQYGFKSIVPYKERLAENSNPLYDLASLTKPLVTAFLTVYLVEKQKIGLDWGVKKFFPQLPREFDITLLQLLTHTSGLPAWYPFYLFGDDYLACFPRLKPGSRPGKKVNYSCPGYILLYYIIEKIAAAPFAAFAREVIFHPAGLKNTFLKTAEIPGHLRTNAVPTEKGNQYERKLAEDWAKTYKGKEGGSCRELVKRYKWRSEIIRGEPHDVNSHHLGGTAGNAGLFSTIDDVFRLCLEFFPGTASLLKAESLQLFRQNFTFFKKSHRTVGFKRNSSFITSGGGALSRAAIGHNGFTGTSLWLEPRDETSFILLSNRVHPVYKPFNFDKPRRRLHRLLVQVQKQHRLRSG